MRPGGPAEPPGPSAGARVVAEWMASKQWVRPPSADAQDDLGRRIDAALAEHWELAEHRKAMLVEREAMVTALREALNELAFDNVLLDATGQAICALCEWSPAGSHAPDCELTSTADAAARCLARARQEGAEAMREKCLELVGRQPDTRTLTRLIRALDAGDPAARRG